MALGAAATMGCSDDDASAPTTSAPVIGPTVVPPDGSTPPSAVGETTTAPPATYLVPSIAADRIPEICAGAQQVFDADSAFATLVGPALQADQGAEADQALLVALTQAPPIIENARQGYDRMAAALPPELATDANAVRDATLTIYAQLIQATTFDELIEKANVGRELAKTAAISGVRLNETTKAYCNGLELSS